MLVAARLRRLRKKVSSALQLDQREGREWRTYTFAPMTAASMMLLWVNSTASSSAGATWLPLTLINSYAIEKSAF